MFRNWAAICRIENPWLRTLAATTDDIEILSGLERGFPHLFQEAESILRVPYSAYLAAARANAEGGTVLMTSIVKKFNLPTIEWGSDMSDSLGSTVPADWREVVSAAYNDRYGYDPVLTGGVPIVIEWQGEELLLVEVNEYDRDTGECAYLIAVPSRFIDFDA